MLEFGARHALGLALSRRGMLTALSTLPLFASPTRLFARGTAETAGESPISALAAHYKGLTSYTDTGTVETFVRWPGAPGVTEQHTFQTAFRAPRKFFFRFDAKDASGDALVIWCDGGPFQSWWKATGVHEVYDGGRGASAFLNAASTTSDTANLIAPHLFSQAKLPGPTTGFLDATAGGEEKLDHRQCRKITASQRTTGVQTIEKRPVTLWIDTETNLVVKVLMDTPAGSAPDTADRKTYLIEPVANPAVDDASFNFKPPGG
jgi:hypothetical protein